MPISTTTADAPVTGTAVPEGAPALPPRISWGAVLAGGLVAVAVGALLNLLGLAVGATTLDPATPGDSPSASLLAMAGGLWLLLANLIGLGMGGWVAARLSGTSDDTDGVLHGLSVWAVGFLLSAVLVAFGLWIRLKLEDTPVFKAIAESGDRPSAPVREVFTAERRPLLAGILSRIGPDVSYALFTLFVLTFATTQLGCSRSEVLGAFLIGSALQLPAIPLAGALTDRVNRRVVYGVAAAIAGVWPFVFFPMISGGSFGLLVRGGVVGLALHSFMYGPQAAFVTEQFSPRLRYTGSSLAYTIAGVVGGAIAPLAFTALSGGTGNWVPVAVYLAVACALTVAGLVLGRDPDHAEDEAYLSVTP